MFAFVVLFSFSVLSRETGWEERLQVIPCKFQQDWSSSSWATVFPRFNDVTLTSDFQSMSGSDEHFAWHEITWNIPSNCGIQLIRC